MNTNNLRKRLQKLLTEKKRQLTPHTETAYYMVPCTLVGPMPVGIVFRIKEAVRNIKVTHGKRKEEEHHIELV